MGGDAREARLAYRPRPLTASHEAAHRRPIPKARGAVQSLGVRYSSPPSGPRGSGGDGGPAPADLPGQTIAWLAAQAGASGKSGARRGAGLSGPAPRSCVSRPRSALRSRAAPRTSPRPLPSRCHAASSLLHLLRTQRNLPMGNRQAPGRWLGGTCRTTSSTATIEKQSYLRTRSGGCGSIGHGAARQAHFGSLLFQQALSGSGRMGPRTRTRR